MSARSRGETVSDVLKSARQLVACDDMELKSSSSFTPIPSRANVRTAPPAKIHHLQPISPEASPPQLLRTTSQYAPAAALVPAASSQPPSKPRSFAEVPTDHALQLQTKSKLKPTVTVVLVKRTQLAPQLTASSSSSLGKEGRQAPEVPRPSPPIACDSPNVVSPRQLRLRVYQASELHPPPVVDQQMEIRSPYTGSNYSGSPSRPVSAANSIISMSEECLLSGGPINTIVDPSGQAVPHPSRGLWESIDLMPRPLTASIYDHHSRMHTWMNETVGSEDALTAARLAAEEIELLGPRRREPSVCTSLFEDTTSLIAPIPTPRPDHARSDPPTDRTMSRRLM